ncbi:hypothetical protein OG413_39990 [Streptomyces sp. NBC_01433]|uniref:hypothetical protein n=1 Tax=Streptomyces sp. NBC_01433 TaxID=2903864 RepID=UPI0022590189|nr:hypothetical protein [Streptomyces sp. NBC_01433]MCX4681380.1 hypothetical protein [Streptomyces sp. NBC_01433]
MPQPPPAVSGKSVQPAVSEENNMAQASAAELTATLYINRSDSECGHCHKPTSMSAHRHTDVSGWTPKPGGGCGARFVNTASHNWTITPDDLRHSRPDLPVRDNSTP